MIRIRAIALLPLFGLIGCGSEEDQIALIPVTGTITANGKPLAGATITFVPDASNPVSTPGADATGPEGSYKVMFRNRSGVAPGKYKVFVMPVDPSSQPVHEAFANDPVMANFANGGGRSASGKREVAGEKSEFDAEVAAKGDNTLDFDVKSSSAKTAKK